MNPRWCVFLSGNGSTAQSLFDNICDLDIRLVVSNKPQAYGVLRAKRMGIPVLIVNNKNLNWLEISGELESRKINRIFLLGFMRILGNDFVNRWQGRIFNVHPSLLPAYRGKEALERSFEDRASIGVTTHEVVTELDAGPIIFQKQVLEPNAAGAELNFHQVRFLVAIAEQRLVRDSAYFRDRLPI